MRAKETDVAASVIQWLEDTGWDVYQEVTYRHRADIVALRGPLTWVIETKTNASLALLDQAMRWRGHAHYVGVGVPYCKSSAFMKVCKDYGIGIFTTGDTSWQSCRLMIKPKLWRRATNRIRDMCCPEHKTTLAAGSSTGSYFSPFRATCNNVREEVVKSPGCTLKELIQSISHHYSSEPTAKQCIASWAKAGAIPGVKCVKEGKFLRFYPSEK